MADNKLADLVPAKEPRRGVPAWAFLLGFAGAALAGSAALLYCMNHEPAKLVGVKPFAAKP